MKCKTEEKKFLKEIAMKRCKILGDINEIEMTPHCKVYMMRSDS